ncbi:hypothetical protein BVRB_5g106100 [Beta vulgaris subsp. vulgaris]|nr:hypothetical protein BVRB_5g106100 [Beta vulgaris subsp. vulgaris]
MRFGGPRQKIRFLPLENPASVLMAWLSPSCPIPASLFISLSLILLPPLSLSLSLPLFSVNPFLPLLTPLFTTFTLRFRCQPKLATTKKKDERKKTTKKEEDEEAKTKGQRKKTKRRRRKGKQRRRRRKKARKR